MERVVGWLGGWVGGLSELRQVFLGARGPPRIINHDQLLRPSKISQICAPHIYILAPGRVTSQNERDKLCPLAKGPRENKGVRRPSSWQRFWPYRKVYVRTVYIMGNPVRMYVRDLHTFISLKSYGISPLRVTESYIYVWTYTYGTCIQAVQYVDRFSGVAPSDY